jgi:hypothetical protein
MKRKLTNQELLDRYVHSVKTLLPPDRMDDIAAEISSNLQSQMEEQAREAGRELRLDELSAILKRHGHPKVVARRYGDRPGRGLIGAELFPFYWSTLRAIVGGWVLVRVIGALLAFHGTANVGSFLLNLSRDIMVEGFLIGSGVTAVFAVWEYLELPIPWPERWKPEDLPPIPLPNREPGITHQRPIVRIMSGVASLFFLVMALFWPAMFWVWNQRGTFSPSATVFAMRLPFLLLALLWISQILLNYTRLAEAEWRSFLRIAINIAGLVFALVLLCQGDLLLAGPNMNPGQGASLVALNRFFATLMLVSCISSGLQCWRELRRFTRAIGWRLGKAISG